MTVRQSLSARVPELPTPPDHLQTAQARELWRATVKDFDLAGHELAVLEQAAKCLDRLVEARELLDVEGICVRDRFGQPRPHPAAAIERDCRIALARLLRELQLGAEAPEPRIPRPVG